MRFLTAADVFRARLHEADFLLQARGQDSQNARKGFTFEAMCSAAAGGADNSLAFHLSSLPNAFLTAYGMTRSDRFGFDLVQFVEIEDGKFEATQFIECKDHAQMIGSGDAFQKIGMLGVHIGMYSDRFKHFNDGIYGGTKLCFAVSSTTPVTADFTDRGKSLCDIVARGIGNGLKLKFGVMRMREFGAEAVEARVDAAKMLISEFKANMSIPLPLIEASMQNVPSDRGWQNAACKTILETPGKKLINPESSVPKTLLTLINSGVMLGIAVAGGKSRGVCLSLATYHFLNVTEATVQRSLVVLSHIDMCTDFITELETCVNQLEVKTYNRKKDVHIVSSLTSAIPDDAKFIFTTVHRINVDGQRFMKLVGGFRFVVADEAHLLSTTNVEMTTSGRKGLLKIASATESTFVAVSATQPEVMAGLVEPQRVITASHELLRKVNAHTELHLLTVRCDPQTKLDQVLHLLKTVNGSFITRALVCLPTIEECQALQLMIGDTLKVFPRFGEAVCTLDSNVKMSKIKTGFVIITISIDVQATNRPSINTVILANMIHNKSQVSSFTKTGQVVGRCIRYSPTKTHAKAILLVDNSVKGPALGLRSVQSAVLSIATAVNMPTMQLLAMTQTASFTVVDSPLAGSSSAGGSAVPVVPAPARQLKLVNSESGNDFDFKEQECFRIKIDSEGKATSNEASAGVSSTAASSAAANVDTNIKLKFANIATTIKKQCIKSTRLAQQQQEADEDAEGKQEDAGKQEEKNKRKQATQKKDSDGLTPTSRAILGYIQKRARELNKTPMKQSFNVLDLLPVKHNMVFSGGEGSGEGTCLKTYFQKLMGDKSRKDHKEQLQLLCSMSSDFARLVGAYKKKQKETPLLKLHSYIVEKAVQVMETEKKEEGDEENEEDDEEDEEEDTVEDPQAIICAVINVLPNRGTKFDEEDFKTNWKNTGSNSSSAMTRDETEEDYASAVKEARDLIKIEKSMGGFLSNLLSTETARSIPLRHEVETRWKQAEAVEDAVTTNGTPSVSTIVWRLLFYASRPIGSTIVHSLTSPVDKRLIAAGLDKYATSLLLGQRYQPSPSSSSSSSSPSSSSQLIPSPFQSSGVLRVLVECWMQDAADVLPQSSNDKEEAEVEPFIVLETLNTTRAKETFKDVTNITGFLDTLKNRSKQYHDIRREIVWWCKETEQKEDEEGKKGNRETAAKKIVKRSLMHYFVSHWQTSYDEEQKLEEEKRNKKKDFSHAFKYKTRKEFIVSLQTARAEKLTKYKARRKANGKKEAARNKAKREKKRKKMKTAITVNTSSSSSSSSSSQNMKQQKKQKKQKKQKQ